MSYSHKGTAPGRKTGLEKALFASVKQLKLQVVTTRDGASSHPTSQVIFLPAGKPKEKQWDTAVLAFNPALQADAQALSKAREIKPEAGSIVSFDRSPIEHVVFAFLPEKHEPFFLLELARKALAPALETKPKTVVIEVRGAGDLAQKLAEACVAAILALHFEFKTYGETPSKPKALPGMVFVVPSAVTLEKEKLREQIVLTCGTNLVRYLSALAGNDLTPSRYVTLATQLAKESGLKAEFFSLQKLERMKAGAFLAVARAAEDKGSGILKVSYQPGRGKTEIALVGKGITFDTGGSQLKTGEHMFGMNGDMGGSAVALALVLIAKELKWKQSVTAYLAITENAIGPKAYRPNDMVKTLSGKTIEVVDSDAEGRMVLSDALHLAGTEKPKLMMDFATLTGACVRAIGTNYCGAYTNREDWFETIRSAGKASGERVWPFPSDDDYGRCLKSDYADIKQCRLTGGSDHIEAGYFLKQFVPEGCGWVHVDLSAAENDEGLAHVPSKYTGFGVRFAAEFIQRATT
jgi:leucyl aminopeptidase